MKSKLTPEQLKDKQEAEAKANAESSRHTPDQLKPPEPKEGPNTFNLKK